MEQQASATLLTCLGNAGETEKVERLKDVTPEVWHAVTAQAGLHRVAPLLYDRTKGLGITLPAELAAELKQAYRQNTRRNTVLYLELGKVLRALQAQAIPTITLKGLHLARLVYDSIGLRPILDIDLLVREDDLLRVETTLFGLGCRPFHPNRVIGPDNYDFAYILPETNLRLEIHWTLIPARYPFQIDLAGLWARAQSVTVANLPMLALCPEDLLLHLCLHAAKDWSLLRLRRLCDISEVVRYYGGVLDWPMIGARAQAWGIVRAVYLMLRLARDLLEAAVPTDWLATLQPDGFNEHYLTLAHEQFLAGPDEAEGDLLVSPYVVVQLWGAKGLGRKLALIRDRLLPSHETMALMYPVPADSWRMYLYYPVRLKDLVVRYGLTLWQLAQGDPQQRSLVMRSDHARELHDWLMSR